MAIHEGREGNWVFVPLPDRPEGFTCLRRTEVVLRLWFRNLPPELYDYCVQNAVLPPKGLTYTRLVKFITEHQTAAKAVCGPALPVPFSLAKAPERANATAVTPDARAKSLASEVCAGTL